MTNPKQIARSLSSVRCKWLLWFPDDRWHTSYLLIYRGTGRHPSPSESGNLTRQLGKMPDLVEKSEHMRGSLGGTGLRLTPFGLVVRAIIEKEQYHA